MEFTNRNTQFPGKRQLIKVNADNIPIVGEDPIFVNIIKDEGVVYDEGTPLTAETLNKGNWRDDKSLSFKQWTVDIPPAKVGETQIVTDINGETWLIPPLGSQNPDPIKIYNCASTIINTNFTAHMDNADVHISMVEKTKLSSIQAGAEVNVQSDWNQDNPTFNNFIRNKPQVSTITWRY